MLCFNASRMKRGPLASAVSKFTSFQMLLKELPDFVEGNNSGLIVIKIYMARTGNNQQLLVISLQFLEGILAEIARMGFLPVNHEHGAADFPAVRQQGHIRT